MATSTTSLNLDGLATVRVFQHISQEDSIEAFLDYTRIKAAV
jgi:hypothetical protein